MKTSSGNVLETTDIWVGNIKGFLHLVFRTFLSGFCFIHTTRRNVLDFEMFQLTTFVCFFFLKQMLVTFRYLLFVCKLAHYYYFMLNSAQ